MCLVNLRKKENAMKTTWGRHEGDEQLRRIICQTQTLKKLRLYLESEDPLPDHHLRNTPEEVYKENVFSHPFFTPILTKYDIFRP